MGGLKPPLGDEPCIRVMLHRCFRRNFKMCPFLPLSANIGDSFLFHQLYILGSIICSAK